MDHNFLIRQRLINQRLAQPDLSSPEAVVEHLVAVQSQEYGQAKWALGLRAREIKAADAEQALTDGRILRTHLMRPTWHFVSPADIRWLLQLTAPRVNAFNAFMYRKMELDEALLRKCSKVIEKALLGGKQLTRDTLKTLLKDAGTDASDTVRMACIMMYAELAGLICSGARQGKQHTYALLEERVAPVKVLTDEEALSLFVERYFSTRGPATAQDFAWWSGLTVKDAKTGIANLPLAFEKIMHEGKEYIFKPAAEPKNIEDTFLLPDYDEYGISYKDRSAYSQSEKFPVNIFSRWIIVDGKAGGTWKSSEKKGAVQVETAPYGQWNKRQQAAVAKTVKRYEAFWI